MINYNYLGTGNDERVNTLNGDFVVLWKKQPKLSQSFKPFAAVIVQVYVSNILLVCAHDVKSIYGWMP